MADPKIDRGLFWTPRPGWQEAEIRRAGWAARPVHGLGQVLVSGKLAAAMAALAPGAAETGLWGLADADRYAVRMARDRALIVTPAPMPVEPGWRAEGWAASLADDLYTVLEIEGEGLDALASEAVTADLDRGSPSAALFFAGIPVLLYRRAPHVARLHVENALAPALWHWLDGR
jgi:hypothetical protein